MTGYENLAGFVNPDETVDLEQNDLGQELPVRIKVGEKVIGATWKPIHSINLRFRCDAYLLANLQAFYRIHPRFHTGQTDRLVGAPESLRVDARHHPTLRHIRPRFFRRAAPASAKLINCPA